MVLGLCRAVFAVLATVLSASGTPAASAEAGKADIAAIGDLLLPFDPAAWRIDNEDGHLVIMQLDRGFGEFGVDVSIMPGTEDGCSTGTVLADAGLIDLDGSNAQAFTLVRPGFDLHIATVRLGCRNWTGSPVFACTFHREKLYSFVADPVGCRTPPNYHEPVIELLGGLRAP